MQSTIRLIAEAAQPKREIKALDGQAKKLEKTVSNTNAKLKDFTRTGNAAAQSLEKQGRAAQKTTNDFGALKRILGGVGFTVLTKQVVGAAASFNSLQLRLRLLTQQYGETEQAQQIIARSAQKFGLSNREAAQGVTDIFARLRPLGVSLKDIESTFVGFNTVAKLSGVESQQASAAFTQLAQALGSGRLQGDEFRSIAEQIPGLLTAVSDVTGIAQGKLKEFASDGLLTSDIIIEALRRAEKDGGAAIAQIVEESDTQKFKDFQNAVDDLSIAFGDALLPALIPAVTATTDLIRKVSELPEPVLDAATKIGLFVAGLVAINLAVKTFIALKAATLAFLAAMKLKIAALNALLLANPWVLLVAGLTAAGIATASYIKKQAELNQLLNGTSNDLQAYNDQIFNHRAALIKAEKRLDEMITSGFDHAESILAQKKEVEKLRLELERLVAQDYQATVRVNYESFLDKKDVMAENFSMDEVNRILQSAPKLTTPKTTSRGGARRAPADPRIAARKNARENIVALKDQLGVAQARTDQEARMLELNQKIREIEAKRSEIGDTLADQQIQLERGLFTTLEIKEALSSRDAEALDRQQKNLQGMEAIFAQGKMIDTQIQKQAEKMNSLYKSIGDTISSGIVDSLTAAVEGTKSLAEVASDTLRNLSQILLQFGVQSLLGGLGGGNKSSIFTKLFGGFRASGGTVTGGRSFVVGERGPELFTPGRTGSIAPNSSMGATSIVVNVDANNTNAQGDNQNGKRLGAAIGAAVQAELVKQKRPGGLLAS